MEVTSLAEVKKLTGRVLVKVEAAHCIPCKQMDLYIEDVCKETATTLVRVNADKVVPILAEAMIRSLPTLLLFRDGVQIGRRSGFLSALKLKQWLLE